MQHGEELTLVWRCSSSRTTRTRTTLRRSVRPRPCGASSLSKSGDHASVNMLWRCGRRSLLADIGVNERRTPLVSTPSGRLTELQSKVVHFVTEEDLSYVFHNLPPHPATVSHVHAVPRTQIGRLA